MKELTGEESSEDSYMKINPMDISNYRPSWDEADETKSEIVSMTTKYGSTTLIYLSISEFEKLLNESQK